MNKNLSKEQLVNMISCGVYNKQYLEDLYQNKKISLEDYCYCIIEIQKKENPIQI